MVIIYPTATQRKKQHGDPPQLHDDVSFFFLFAALPELQNSHSGSLFLLQSNWIVVSASQHKKCCSPVLGLDRGKCIIQLSFVTHLNLIFTTLSWSAPGHLLCLWWMPEWALGWWLKCTVYDDYSDSKWLWVCVFVMVPYHHLLWALEQWASAPLNCSSSHTRTQKKINKKIPTHNPRQLGTPVSHQILVGWRLFILP